MKFLKRDSWWACETRHFRARWIDVGFIESLKKSWGNQGDFEEQSIEVSGIWYLMGKISKETRNKTWVGDVRMGINKI
ncbi:unnamed protein product [Blepharisma stoltei]|uniref:Uncharacterized protein n=1 Tax=Blepharisma stoltei TaxID=1481888 RepID=A0AAU9IMN1_9CILI|nr:unnamed protein product [Blepharisma stoltei]